VAADPQPTVRIEETMSGAIHRGIPSRNGTEHPPLKWRTPISVTSLPLGR
jgi:hypothetical protein